MRRPVPFALALVIALVAGLAACSDDGGTAPDGDDGPPTPHDGSDEITFRIFVEDRHGEESLRWVGDGDGPAETSPETTDQPFVPFGRPFRVEWEVDAAGAPVVGTRYRIYRDPGESFFLPFAGPDSVAYDDTRSFRFANEVAPSAIDPATCGTGPACYGDVRLDSGQVSFEVQSINGNGRVIDSLQTVEIEVNYPPRVEFVEAPPQPDSTFAFPGYRIDLRDGGQLVGALAAGDTLPSGAEVRVRLRGRDRLPGAADEDSLCCDERFDDEVPAIRYQARTLVTLRNDFGTPTTIETFFGPVLEDSVLVVRAGPGDYEIEVRSVDEHGRRSDSRSFRFHAGLPPRAPVMQPDDGAEFVLLPPDVDPPRENGVPLYEVVAQTRYFDPEFGRWVSEQEGAIQQSGHSYRIAAFVTAAADPRAERVTNQLAGGFTDLPRGFAYEMVSEFDPLNEIAQGPGDRIDFFLNATVVGRLELDEGDLGFFDGIDVFVPEAFWDFPSLYDSTIVDPTGPEPAEQFVAVGDRIRRDLGEYTYRARARTTARSSAFVQAPPLPEGVVAENAEFEVGDFPRFGLRSPISEQSFSIRLRLTTGAGILIWPSVADALPVASSRRRD